MFTGANYRGRFAPSPTGSLHLGSLFSALISYLHARSKNGTWLIRIDDIDPPRTVEHSAKNILKALESYGLFWDEEVVYQSQRHHYYDEALAWLKKLGLSYPCSCSRSELSASSGKHFGKCKNNSGEVAWRLATSNTDTVFTDSYCGHCSQNLSKTSGDFILQRKDGFYAYQLATAIDDHEQGITHVVRGRDLLESTARQILVLQSLNYSIPEYSHHALLTSSDGEKLSKQNNAPAIIDMPVKQGLYQCLIWAGLNPEVEMRDASVQEQLHWACQNWHASKLLSTPCESINIGEKAQG